MECIGRSKFCIASACTIQKYDTTKCHPQPGLYIRVPKKMDQCFWEPCLPDGGFDSDLASVLLSAENTLEEWVHIFATITKQETKLTAEQWTHLKKNKDRAKEFTTPKKEKKVESLASLNLSYIGDSLNDIKNEVQSGRDPNDVNVRLVKLEAQVELIGERLEEWALDNKFKELQGEDHNEDLRSFLLKIESQIGKIPQQYGKSMYRSTRICTHNSTWRQGSRRISHLP